MEQAAECMLVLIGATPEGKKELVGFQTGVRESAQSWRELLIDIKQRGLEIAPDLAVGDGALGFWKAIEEVFPDARHQRCWVHKTANVLNKVALSVQINMRADLREIYGAPTRAAAETAIDVFADKYGAKYDKAVACLTKDREALLAFFDFPAEHWDHLRTSNPIESVFAPVNPDRRGICDGASWNRADQGSSVGQDRQAHGVQTRQRRRKNMAAIKGRKPVAESRPGRQIPKWHRGHRIVGSPRRLINLVTQSPAQLGYFPGHPRRC